jgi:Fe-S cluster assembly ATP-binding protein
VATEDGRSVLAGVSLVVRAGERHAVVGPKGAGKTALARALLGHPELRVTAGDIRLDGESILPLTTAARARKGLFLAFEEPPPLAGVSTSTFLRQAANAVRGEPVSLLALQQDAKKAFAELGLEPSFGKRTVNEGPLEAGLRARGEALQLALLKPRFALVDGLGQGLGPDTLRAVARAVRDLGRKDAGAILFAADAAALEPFAPHHVHVLEAGRIVRSERREVAA